MRLAIPHDIDPQAIAGIDRAAQVSDLIGETMGTVWRVRLTHPAGADLAELRRRIAARLAGIVAQMSHWEPGSLLSRFNHAAAGSWTRLPADFRAVMIAAFDLAARSGGAFDPAIGRLVDLWGFGARPHQDVPDAAAIARAQGRSGWRRLTFDRATGWLHQPGGVELDLSGIAKGYAVDAVVALLHAQGFGHALVEIGGECRGSGVRPDDTPWWVDLETPPDTDLTPLRIALHGLSVATSGDYVRGHHTIDPRDGRPVRGVVAVSVLHRQAMLADGWASALTVLGPGAAEAMAAREQLAVRCVFRDSAGQREWISPALAAMLT